MLGIAALLGVVGGLLVLAGRLGLGRLPGDISFGSGGMKVYIPLATCLLVSVVATIILNVFLRR